MTKGIAHTTGGASTELGGADPLVGTPYRTLGMLGQGGMGVVVDAEHVALRKRVVVKLLRRELSDRPDLVDRMRVEGQTLALLSRENHNLVDVTDFGQTPQGRTFLVMERLFGRTLKDELRELGVVPIVDAIDWVRQTLAGLHAAHEAGIVHRDVKLDNLFLCDAPPSQVVGAPPPRRVVKVLDFGIAKIGDDSGIAPLAQPTQEGSLMGTPRFLSPEQARGGTIDRRTDVYGAGMVLYTLLAGRGPFHHLDDAVSLLRAHAFDPPAPASQLAAQPIPPELDAIVLKAVAKKPDERFASAAAFAKVLGDFAERFVASGGAATTEKMTPTPSAPPAPAFAPRSTPPRGIAHATTEPSRSSAAPPAAAPAGPAPMSTAPSRAPTEAGAPAGSASASGDAAPGSRLAPTVRKPRADGKRAESRWGLFVMLVVASTLVFTAVVELARRMQP